MLYQTFVPGGLPEFSGLNRDAQICTQKQKGHFE